MVVFTFKIAYTEDKISYDIPNSWNTKYAFLRIRDYIVDDFNLNNCFEFVYVNGIPLSYNGVMEEYEDIESEFSQKCLTIQRNLIPNAPRETTINKVIENISKNSGIIE